MRNWFKKKKAEGKATEAEQISDKDDNSLSANWTSSSSRKSADRELQIISCDAKSKSESHIPDIDTENPATSERQTKLEPVTETTSEILETVSEDDIKANKYSPETLAEIHKSVAVLDKSEEKPRSILATKSEGQARFEPSVKNVTFEDQEDEGQHYTFDEAVDKIGYGWFQRTVTFLTGLGWFAESYAIIITSILQDFLACDWTLYMWQVAALTSAMFIGMMFGAPVWGVVADKWGRKMSLAVSMAIAFVFGALSAAAPSPEWMMLCRGLMGFALGSLAQGVTLCIEYYPVKDRGTAGFYINYYWCIGNATLILVAWLIIELTGYWRLLVLVASFPCVMAFISMKWYPESVRYYMVSNQYDKAVSQLNKLAEANKADLPEGTMTMTFMDREESMGNVLDLLRPPHTLTTLLYWYIWFAVSFHYYGLALVTPVIVKQGKVMVTPEEAAHAAGTNMTSQTNFFMAVYPCLKYTSDNYLDLFWTSCAEIPGILIFPILVKYIARKKLLASSVLINSVLVLLLLIDFGSSIPSKICLFTARSNGGGFYQLIMIMCGEAFPTTLRATSLGSSHAFSMFGAAMVPFAAQILIIHQPVLALCLISGVLILVGAAACLLPREMKDVPMKDYSEQFVS